VIDLMQTKQNKTKQNKTKQNKTKQNNKQQTTKPATRTIHNTTHYTILNQSQQQPKQPIFKKIVL
jgi:hypothetical protein